MAACRSSATVKGARTSRSPHTSNVGTTMLGSTYLVVPWAPLPETPTLDDVKHLAGMLEQAGKQAAQAGLKFGYHNHDFEFKLVEGKPIMDHLLAAVPADALLGRGNERVEARNLDGVLPLLAAAEAEDVCHVRRPRAAGE